MNKSLLLVALILFSVLNIIAQDRTVYVYGPGGPYPAIKEAAETFEKQFNIPVQVTKGPLNNWEEKAKENADIFYSGAENMMTTFSNIFEGQLLPETIYPLHYRGSGLIVRKGNPKKIKSLSDLQKPGINILVVNGAGLTGVWEDMLGNMKNMDAFRKIRSNIVFFAGNSGLAEKYWREHPEVDVWISWNIWQIANADSADFVKLKRRYTIYRDCGIAMSASGIEKENAQLFFDYLKSEEASKIFRKWGWE